MAIFEKTVLKISELHLQAWPRNKTPNFYIEKPRILQFENTKMVKSELTVKK
jgi:hypothetical protein